MNKKAKVVNYESLAQGFRQLTLESETFIAASPGNYILIENDPCYLLNIQDKTADFILSPENVLSQSDLVNLSPLQGKPLPLPDLSQMTVLVANEQGLSALLFYLKKYRKNFNGIAFIGTKQNFPFLPCPSRQLISGLPPEVIAALPLLEDWQIPNRLACLTPKPGCFMGSAISLAENWMAHIHSSSVQLINIENLNS